MIDGIYHIVIGVRTDEAGKRSPVGMVKECCKDSHAFDPQQICFEETIIPNDRVLSSVEILMFAQPSPYFAETLITGSVDGVSIGIASSIRGRRGRVYILHELRGFEWL
jgi:hypothetical protein